MTKDIIQKKEGVEATGEITIRSYQACTCLDARVTGHCQHKLGGRMRPLLNEMVQSNLIMQGASTGKDLLVQRLIGDTTYTAIINYGAIGTGSTAPVVGNTQLQAEVARTTVAFAQDVGNNEAVVQFFFADTNLANGTYHEFGTFIDGTASANTGRIFNRAIFSSAYTKAAGTDTTVEVDITFT